MTIKFKGCHPTNFRKGRSGYKPEVIVIHIMDGTLYGTDSHFMTQRPNPSSAHYGIGCEWDDRASPNWPVAVHQYVNDEDTAFHAGWIKKPTWQHFRKRLIGNIQTNINPNYYTIGIECQGKPEDIWKEKMYITLADLVAIEANAWQIPIDRDHIIGHREIDMVNKPNCPGQCDLEKLVAMAKEVKV